MSSATSLHAVAQSDFNAQEFEPLRQAHRRIQELEVRVEELTTRNGYLELELANLTRKRKPRKAIAGSEAASVPQRVVSPHSGIIASPEAMALAHKIDVSARKASSVYLYLFSPYLLPDGVFGMDEPPFAFNSKERFADGVSLEERQAADLYAAVPEEDHHYISSNNRSYAKKFFEHLGTHRSHMIKRARQVAPFLFASESEIAPGELGASESKTRLNNARICTLAGYDSQKDPCWMRYPPALYAELSGRPQDLFRNPMLIQLYRGVLYGLSAAQSADFPVASLSFRSKNALSALPSLSTSAGIIGNASVLLRFLLSNDAEFVSTGMGSDSRIPYISDHDKYCKVLVTTWDSVGTQSLIDHWNGMLFPGSTNLPPPSLNGTRAETRRNVNDSLGEEEIMRGLAEVNLQSHEFEDDVSPPSSTRSSQIQSLSTSETRRPTGNLNAPESPLTNISNTSSSSLDSMYISAPPRSNNTLQDLSNISRGVQGTDSLIPDAPTTIDVNVDTNQDHGPGDSSVAQSPPESQGASRRRTTRSTVNTAAATATGESTASGSRARRGRNKRA
ncbi:hypothetical protein FA15DRAFT_660793 [Coprinopsis marcescibilis]|uniref:Uncharacterized protein n=1 Tax=Coprinopsis marcescibilis TaxID=230819 RepID=A0A5C3KET9_COPMA|nr:hypothetical protein FA15DRAFT_660793 [Coprinopsis marcescibilis]